MSIDQGALTVARPVVAANHVKCRREYSTRATSTMVSEIDPRPVGQRIGEYLRHGFRGVRANRELRNAERVQHQCHMCTEGKIRVR